MKGRGPKSSVCPSKPRETKLFGRISQDFCQDMPGVPEEFKPKKSSCSILVLYLLGMHRGLLVFSALEVLFQRPAQAQDSISCRQKIEEEISCSVEVCRKPLSARNFGQP